MDRQGSGSAPLTADHADAIAARKSFPNLNRNSHLDVRPGGCFHSWHGGCDDRPVIRVTPTIVSPREACLLVSGQIAGSHVALLEEEIAKWRGRAGRIVLDLSGVSSIDEDGLALLRRATPVDFGLRTGSAYLRSLLEAEGLGEYLSCGRTSPTRSTAAPSSSSPSTPAQQ